MSPWDSYPSNYRAPEIQAILAARRAGACFSLVGLSGAGKSNLAGFLVHRGEGVGRFVLVDCNRLTEPTPAGFFALVERSLGTARESRWPYEALAESLAQAMEAAPGGLCLVLDRFDALPEPYALTIASNLRALRDAHKYRLTLLTVTRRPLDSQSELAELAFGHTFWLGPLQESDARWNVARLAARHGQAWGEETIQKLIACSWGYPSFLKAICEAHAGGCSLDSASLRAHPGVARCLEEFWSDSPTPEMVALSGLTGNPLLAAAPAPFSYDPAQLTAKEHLLLEYLLAHEGEVCEKDDLIRAVWPEDRIYETGVRDDSLAQLVRRLRVKIEADPSAPQVIHTVAGRGYLLRL